MSNGPTSQSENISLQALIDLAEKLLDAPDLNSQKKELLSFLTQFFGGKAALWLNTANHPQSEKPLQPPPSEVADLTAAWQKDQSASQTALSNGSYQCVSPITHRNQSLGVMTITRDDPFQKSELDSLVNIGRMTGIALYALQQKRLHQWHRQQLALVRSVSRKISKFSNLETLSSQITSLVQETFNYYYVAIFLIKPSTKRLRFKASASACSVSPPEFEQVNNEGFRLGQHIIGHVAESGQEHVANDVTKEPRYQSVKSLPETRSEAVMPLKIEGKVLGVFDIQSEKKNAFHEDDLVVLRALADHIAIAVETTRLIEDVRKRADHLAIVAEVSRKITKILDQEKLLTNIVELIHNRFKIPFVHLYLVDPVQKKIVFKAGSGETAKTIFKAQLGYDMHAKQGIIPWVVQNQQSKRIDNVNNEPNYIENPFTKGKTVSEMAIPLLFGNDVLGVLDVQSDVEAAFSIENQKLIETLADNVAIAIRNASLYRSEKWRRQVAESLRDVAGLLSDNTALDDVLNAILSELKKNLPCDAAGIWLLNANDDSKVPIAEQELSLAACCTNRAFSQKEMRNVKFLPDEWVKQALNQETPKIRQSSDSAGPIATHFDMPEEYSAIAAPLHTGSETLGLLTLLHHTPDRYGLESQKITSAFASYAAIAIENTRLFASSQEQAWISTILLQVAHATQSQTTIEELVETIVRLTPLVVGVKGCALFLRDPDSDIFSLHAAYGIGRGNESLELNHPIPLTDAPILEELMLTQMPLFIQDPVEDLHLPTNLSQHLDEDTMVLLPLIARSEMLGAFLLVNDQNLNDDQTIEMLSDERLGIIQGITQQTAIAVENIRLLEQKQEEAYVSNVLLQVAQAVVSSSSLDDTLDSIVHIMPILVGIDSCLIYFWDKSERVFKITQAYTKNTEEEEKLISNTYEINDFPMLDAVYKNNRPIVYPFIDNLLPPEDWDLALPDEEQIDPFPVLQSQYPILLGFPLSVKDEVYGVILAQDKNFSSNRERRFELLFGISQQASLAIQNDQLNKEMLDRQRLEREFQLAREIQQTFLPNQMPEMPGWEMDVRWHTARQVGGDFYDYFLLPDGRLAFVIADVSNKGLAASLYMTVTRTLLRASAFETYSTARTLERVNDLLLMNSENGLFVTTFYGILSLSDGKLTYTNAGHNPPILIQKHKKTIKPLKTGGIALGALENITLEQNQILIEPGDCLVLYTDGVTEAFASDDRMYGDERLEAILSNSIGENAHSVLQTLEDDLADFRKDAPLSDDTTMLAICRSDLLADKDGDGRISQDIINSAAE